MRAVEPSGAADFEAVPGREEYDSGEDGSAAWAKDMLEFADDNFNDAGNEVRSMDMRDRQVGLFGDFCERIGHGKFVEWRADEESGGVYKLEMVTKKPRITHNLSHKEYRAGYPKFGNLWTSGRYTCVTIRSL